MALTDIFIKRPVLSVVVSLLILLIGFALDQMGKIVDRYAVAHVERVDPSLVPSVCKTNAQGKPVALDEKAVEKLPEGSRAHEVVDEAKREGFSMAFRWTSILPLALIFIFGAIALSDRMRCPPQVRGSSGDEQSKQ